MSAPNDQRTLATNGAPSALEGHGTEFANALPLVQTIFRLLNSEDIRYCHWKSNLALPASMRGETDLDLLVDTRDSQRFREILGRNGCRPVISDSSRHFPGLEDWLGLDVTEGRLIHLHLHYRLVLGEQLVKNYLLPLERCYLDSVTLQHGIKVPAPELELIVLVLRALLKYRDRDLLSDLLGRGRSGIPPSILREFEFLKSETSPERIGAALQLRVPFISPALVFDFLSTIETNPRSGLRLLKLRRQVRRDLSPFQRHSRLRARAIYFRRMIARETPFYRLLFPFRPSLRKRKTPVSGGLTVAIVGVDGAGKSTVVQELTRFFSWRLVTQSFYMGNTKNSLSRFAANAASMVARRAKPDPLRRWAKRGHELMLAVQSLADAQGRYRQYQAGRKAAAAGTLAVFDRFPLEAIQFEGHAMDGARIAARNRSSTPNFLVRWMAAREQQYYSKILLPDLLIILQIKSSVAMERKPDHSPEKISNKCQAVSAIRREGLPLLEIDASRPLNEVLNEVKSAIWRLL